MKDSVLITGAGSGLGRALAIQFAREGHTIILHGRNQDALTETAVMIGSSTSIVLGDLRRSDTIQRLASCFELHEAGILINNAGTYLRQELPDCSLEDVHEVLDTNLIAPMLLIRAVYEPMRRCGGGMIVNINSLAAVTPSAGESVYSASKGGLRAFSHALSMESTAQGIHVLNVSIGAMGTAMQMERTDPLKCIEVEEAAEAIYAAATQRRTLRVSELEIKRSRY